MQILITVLKLSHISPILRRERWGVSEKQQRIKMLQGNMDVIREIDCL